MKLFKSVVLIITAFIGLIGCHSKRPDYYSLGVSCSDSGRYEEAIEAFNQSIKINPNDAGAYYNLGEIYKKMGKDKESIDYFKEAIKHDSCFTKAYRNLGEAYEKLGMLKEADEVYKEAKRVNHGYDDKSSTFKPYVSGEENLIIAAERGNLLTVKELIAKGVDVNARMPDNGGTALILASQNGHIEIVKELLAKGADVNAKTNDGKTALTQAARNGHSEIVQLLREAKAK